MDAEGPQLAGQLPLPSEAGGPSSTAYAAPCTVLASAAGDHVALRLLLPASNSDAGDAWEMLMATAFATCEEADCNGCLQSLRTGLAADSLVCASGDLCGIGHTALSPANGSGRASNAGDCRTVRGLLGIVALPQGALTLRATIGGEDCGTCCGCCCCCGCC